MTPTPRAMPSPLCCHSMRVKAQRRRRALIRFGITSCRIPRSNSGRPDTVKRPGYGGACTPGRRVMSGGPTCASAGQSRPIHDLLNGPQALMNESSVHEQRVGWAERSEAQQFLIQKYWASLTLGPTYSYYSYSMATEW